MFELKKSTNFQENNNKINKKKIVNKFSERKINLFRSIRRMFDDMHRIKSYLILNHMPVPTAWNFCSHRHQ